MERSVAQSCLRLCTMMAKLVVLLVMMLAVAVLPGCKQPKSPDAALLDPLSPTSYPQIAALGGLGQVIRFSSPSVRSDPEGQLSITVPIRLLQDQEKGIEYKYEFFNKDGSPILGGADWQYMKLPPHTVRFVEGHAKTASHRDWRLLLRPAQQP